MVDGQLDFRFLWQFVLDTALLKWLSEHAVSAYTTLDSAVSYL